jgi:endonuclease/exonuclease/phosphatase family metal-dependent hydrolase
MRIVTYNVHRCVGTDRRLDVDRVAAVLAALEADIVCLQELDVGRARTGGVDQAEAIALSLQMQSRFHPAMKVEEELYGDAILTALPHQVIKAGALPTINGVPGLEPRGALWLELDLAAGERLQLINTHLGLVPREQRLQAAHLLGAGWTAGARKRGPTMVIGDFNAPPASTVYRMFRARLEDAQMRLRRPFNTLPTFPSAFPVLRIDHCFVSDAVKVRDVWVESGPLARRASDHLPLVVDFELG